MNFFVDFKKNIIFARRNLKLYMATKEGYVYIFTNESFRDGWVKIGKTQDIKRRLKDLDNTSCPLPFKVFATMKTCKYNEAEELVQEFIAHFNSDLRIRPNREYFKVSPEEALKIFYQVKKVIDDAEIEVFANGKSTNATKRCKKDIKTSPHLIPCFYTRNSDAKGLLNPETEELIVLEGSKINPGDLPNLSPEQKAKRMELIAKCTRHQGEELVLIKDISFKSPSGAAKFCCGGSSNGWNKWKDEQGNPIEKYRK